MAIAYYLFTMVRGQNLPWGFEDLKCHKPETVDPRQTGGLTDVCQNFYSIDRKTKKMVIILAIVSKLYCIRCYNLQLVGVSYLANS